jgi:glycogen debranching enzyme
MDKTGARGYATAMADDLITLDGTTFFHTDGNGDVEADEAKGYFFRDVRHLSRWRLRLNERELQCLSSTAVNYYSARIVLGTDGEQPEITVVRDRFVTDGIHEDLTVTNHSTETKDVKLELVFDSDFADITEARETSPDAGGHPERHETDGQTSLITQRRGSFHRATRVRFSRRTIDLEDGHAAVLLRLKPREAWHTCIDVEPVVDGKPQRALRRCNSFNAPEPGMAMTMAEWMQAAPTVDSDWDDLDQTYRQSLRDLGALRIRADGTVEEAMPAGGMPWYMALFGRDPLWTSYLALPFQPSLARATLRTLARIQADDYDDFRDAEPGKILHEKRNGKTAYLDEEPSPYYGTHDATSLFLIVLDEYQRWTGDDDFVRELEPNARAALAWIEGPADLDGDGYLEYRSRSAKGLNNHGWKDSDDGILHPDGSQPEKPLAVCEVQAYAYDARRRAARLAREVWNDEPLAGRLRRDARALKQRFNEDFWDARRRHYALALDGSKRPVSPPASNMGHLLFSGIVDDDRAGAVVRRLLRPDLFSGWGIRTVSTETAAYSPLRYHQGTVWPHDTAICAEGMRRYGFRKEATRVAFALLEAAAAFENRLPECFAGFARDETCVMVEYPGALRPQAWSAAAPLSCLRTILGLDVSGGRLRRSPVLPDGLARLRLHGVHVHGKQVDV